MGPYLATFLVGATKLLVRKPINVCVSPTNVTISCPTNNALKQRVERVMNDVHQTSIFLEGEWTSVYIINLGDIRAHQQQNSQVQLNMQAEMGISQAGERGII